MEYNQFFDEIQALGKLFNKNFNEKHIDLIFNEVNGYNLPDNAVEEVKRYLIENNSVNSLKPVDLIRAFVVLNLCEVKEDEDNFFCEKCGNSGWVSFKKDGFDYACICDCNCKKAIKLRENREFRKVMGFREMMELKDVVVVVPSNPFEKVIEKDELVLKLRELRESLKGSFVKIPF